MNAKTLAAMRALGTVPATPESDADADATPAVPSFDGGARQSPPLAPETHGEWLVKVVRRDVMPVPPE